MIVIIAFCPFFRWMAPECIAHNTYSGKTTVWSFGILIWEIYSYGMQPYCGYSNQEVGSKKVFKNSYTYDLSSWENPACRILTNHFRDSIAYTSLRLLTRTVYDDNRYTFVFQVLDMITRFQLLTCPDQCPARVYSLMRECWTQDPGMRPNFKVGLLIVI